MLEKEKPSIFEKIIAFGQLGITLAALVWGITNTITLENRLKQVETKNDYVETKNLKNENQINLAQEVLEVKRKELVEGNNSLTLEGIKLERGNYERLKASEEIDKTLSLSKFENDKLTKENIVLYHQQSELSTQLSDAQRKTNHLTSNLEKSQEEMDFGTYAYSLHVVKYNQVFHRYPSIKRLIDGLKTDNRFKKRIADSLENFQTLPNNYLFGLSNLIMYAGTGKSIYKKNILNEIENHFQTSLTSIYYNELFISEHWNMSDIQQITGTLIRMLPKLELENDKIFLLRTVAEIDNYHTNFNLYKADYLDFLFYLKECKSLLKNEKWSYQVYGCLTIICPQIYLSHKYTFLAENSKKIGHMMRRDKFSSRDSGNLARLYDFNANENLYSNNEMLYYNNLLFNEPTNTKYFSISQITKKHKKTFEFWNNVFENKPEINDRVVQEKLEKKMF